MEQAEEEVERRRAALSAALLEQARRDNWAAHWNEGLVNIFFYLSMLAGGLAVVAGLEKAVEIPTWGISILAAVGTGAQFFAREAKFWAKAMWFYSRRDLARQLAARLDYEMPFPITIDNIAAISREWRERRSALYARPAPHYDARPPNNI